MVEFSIRFRLLPRETRRKICPLTERKFMANCLNRRHGGSTWCTKIYTVLAEAGVVVQQILRCPLFSRQENSAETGRKEGGGLPLLADLHLVFSPSIKFRSSALALDIVRGEDSDNYWKLEAVILFTGSQNYDRRKVNAGVRKQREHRGGKSRGRNEGKLGLRRGQKYFPSSPWKEKKRGRTFRHFITRLSRVSYLLTFVDREPGCTEEETKESLHPASIPLFPPSSTLSSL